MQASSELVEELIADMRALTQSLVQWGDRWSKIGDQIEHIVTDSQREEIKIVLSEFMKAVATLGSEST